MSKQKFRGVQFLEVVRQGKFTVAFGTYSDAEVGRVNFAGVSARNPEDRKDNSRRGRNFAKSRAFRDLAKKIDKQEWQGLQKRVVVAKTVSKLSPAEIEAKKAEGAEKRAEREARRNGKESTPSQPENKTNPKGNKKRAKVAA